VKESSVSAICRCPRYRYSPLPSRPGLAQRLFLEPAQAFAALQFRHHVGRASGP
jgi:hypothetical protein